MTRVIGREAVLILVSGLLGMLAGPLLTAMPFTPSLFWVGLLMGVTFAPMYALSALAGSKMPVRARNGVALFSGATLLLESLMFLQGVWKFGIPLTPRALYGLLAPVLFGLLLPALAALQKQAGARLEAALAALFAYAFPVLIVRWFLVAMVSDSLQLSAIALQLGAVYMLLHGLLRIYRPGPAEGATDRPLHERPPVPYAVVTLVERTARRRALPYATDAAGGRDRRAISIACAPADAEDLIAKLQAALRDMPFAVSAGETRGGTTEISIRPRS